MELKSDNLYLRFDLIVIGGGASGMIAAGRAGERGLKVLLLEKNKKLGTKLSITGGGRCNILNAEDNEQVLLKKYGSSEQALYSVFSQFGMKKTYSFFESQGLPIVIEHNKRAFPASHNANDVVSTLEAYVRKNGVVVKTGTAVTEVVMNKGMIEKVVAGKEEFFAKEYILATGSVSHKETGSTGDGFMWLKNLGHTVHAPTPTIVPIAVTDQWIKTLAGVSLENIKITFFIEGVKAFNLSGTVLCTHFGLSGPLILNNAHKVADLLHSGTVTGTIDLFAGIDFPLLEQKIIDIFEQSKNKTLKNVLKEILPLGTQKGISLIIADFVPLDTKVHSVTKEMRKKLLHILKELPLTVEGLMGFDRAVVADGGIPLNEVDMKTMRSKKVRNLCVTGDLLHINRPSGGYSLQLCWTTGYVAGSSIAEK